WIHQNNLLWGRLQTITAIQGGVIAGWFALIFGENPHPTLGMALAALGVWLSWRVEQLIECDIKWRNSIRQRLQEVAKEKNEQDPLPQVHHVFGWQIIKEIAIGFVLLDVLLFGIGIGLFYLIHHCSHFCGN